MSSYCVTVMGGLLWGWGKNWVDHMGIDLVTSWFRENWAHENWPHGNWSNENWSRGTESFWLTKYLPPVDVGLPRLRRCHSDRWWPPWGSGAGGTASWGWPGSPTRWTEGTSASCQHSHSLQRTDKFYHHWMRYWKAGPKVVQEDDLTNSIYDCVPKAYDAAERTSSDWEEKVFKMTSWRSLMSPRSLQRKKDQLDATCISTAHAMIFNHRSYFFLPISPMDSRHSNFTESELFGFCAMSHENCI